MDDPAVSSPAPEESASPAPVGDTTVQEAAPQAQTPFHLHPRFTALTTENRNLKSAVAQLNQKMQQFEATQKSGQASSDEQRQLTEAGAALIKIFNANPELKAMFDSRQYLPQLTQGYQSLTQAQQSSQRESARGYVQNLAKEAGMPADPKWTPHLVRLVAGAAMGLEQGNERFERGDFSVLKEAFDQVKGEFFDILSKAGATQVATGKSKLQRLPPAPRGGQAGEPAPEGVKPGEEKQFTAGLHKKALAMLREAATG